MHDTCIPSPSFFLVPYLWLFASNSQQLKLFSISLEGLSDWESTVVILFLKQYCLRTTDKRQKVTKVKQECDESILQNSQYSWNTVNRVALQTPCHNGHLDKTDSSYIPGKNKLQTFNWNKLPLLRTLANEDTTSTSLQCLL